MAKKTRRRFARARRLHSYVKSKKIPLAATMGFISPFIKRAPSGNTVVGRLLKGDFEGAIYDAKEVFTGVDAFGQFHADWVVSTYTPVVVGALVSKFVGGKPLNMNRYISQIPYVKI